MHEQYPTLDDASQTFVAFGSRRQAQAPIGGPLMEIGGQMQAEQAQQSRLRAGVHQSSLTRSGNRADIKAFKATPMTTILAGIGQDAGRALHRRNAVNRPGIVIPTRKKMISPRHNRCVTIMVAPQ
jgi:hypothetical protein